MEVNKIMLTQKSRNSIESEILKYRSVLALNREVFLLNFGQELQVFDDTDKKLQKLIGVIASKESDKGESHVGLIPFLLILVRQSRNAFECLSRYQAYDAWIIFRPALEAVLVVGKFLDDPANANLWKNRRGIWTNRRRDKQSFEKYRKEFEGDGLIPKILPQGEKFRRLLSYINDEFMHMNFDYFERNYEVQAVDDENDFIKTSFIGGDSQEHRAFLFSFLHVYRLLTSSLGQALKSKFTNEVDLDVELTSFEKIWEPKVREIIEQRPDLKAICCNYGLWDI